MGIKERNATKQSSIFSKKGERIKQSNDNKQSDTTKEERRKLAECCELLEGVITGWSKHENLRCVQGRGEERKMAESVVSLVIEQLVPLLLQETNLLCGVHMGMTSIKDELERIRVFLKDADARVEIDGGVKVWVKQVREVAYDIEDVLDEFTFRLAQHSHRHGFVGFLRKIPWLVKHLKAFHVIANEIQDIRTRLHEINERCDSYHFDRSDQGTSSHTHGNDAWLDPRMGALYAEEIEIVGIEKPRKELIDWLVEGVPKRTVFSVVGMGGVGKTTLVKKVYDSEQVRRHFECHAWITVSQSFKVEELLRTLIKRFYKSRKESAPEGIDAMEHTDLIDTLREYLRQKRYVAILDDVWSVELWNSIKHALLNNECGSRIMVTTRLSDVASSCVESSNHIYHLEPLPHKEALNLFLIMAFGSNFGEHCPPELMELAVKIVNKCGRLPLAIVAIRGVLLTKDKTVLEWKKLHDNLPSEFENKSVMRILSLSYHDLPPHLKSCFLYFGIFAEDYFVRFDRLTRLWIAEGFVTVKRGKTLEEVAEDYVNELIQRSLVQLDDLFIDEADMRGLRVHDLMHEFILLRLKEESFCDVVAENTGIGLREKGNGRRLSIHINSAGENAVESTNPSRIRSFLVSGLDDLDEFPNSLYALLSNFRLLKVLDLEDAPLESFPSKVTKLCHLRYLSFRGTSIRMLPNSLGKLQNLETLDLSDTCVVELPIAILKLRKLRHIEASQITDISYRSFNFLEGVTVPEGIGCLTSLQTLLFIEEVNSKGTSVFTDLGKLSQLRKLGIMKLRRESGKDLCASIAKMNHLQYLNVSSIREEDVLDLQFLSSPPPLLYDLILRGRLTKLPDWITSTYNIVSIVLNWSRLGESPLEVLQALPNLTYLRLQKAYDGEMLGFEAKNFQKLKWLFLYSMDRLSSVIVEKGAMPSLQNLEIGPCQLKEVPSGITHLTNLKSLYFIEMPEEFKKRLVPDVGEDYWIVKHIPEVYFADLRDGGYVNNRLQ